MERLLGPLLGTGKKTIGRWLTSVSVLTFQKSLGKVTRYSFLFFSKVAKKQNYAISFESGNLLNPLNPKNLNSHLSPLFISYRNSGEELITYEANLSFVILSVILMDHSVLQWIDINKEKFDADHSCHLKGLLWLK